MMKAYVTKDKCGIIQLWNNKPEWNEYGQFFQAWIKYGYENEVAVDVSNNKMFCNFVTFEESPKEIEL